MSLRPSARRGVLAALAVALVAPLSLTVLAAPSVADDDATLTVVGTSDVFDSNLVQTVLKPGFEAAYPQYTLNYVSKGTGAAIAYAEAGTASAMLVHAAALENQFVDAGYSNEPYGRAIFWGDYVLLGPDADPAGVMTSDSHDIVGAFEKIAAAGASGDADFVSRGGTPGTTVQEHAIWALTTGVQTCNVSDANGGGTSPSTDSGDCGTTINYPSWYHATGLTQGPNIINADACNYGNGQDCYVLTDRGTFQYLVSTNAITNLKIVTRDNLASSTGGVELLVNSFHAYAINPAKFASDPNVHINVPAATAFLNWVTSPAGQDAVGDFLNEGDDAPFLPSASPAVTVNHLPATITAGRSITVKGDVTNVVPGTPVLNNVQVNLMAVPASAPGSTPTKVAGARTNGQGDYTISYTPNSNRIYSVVVPSITKIENDTLDPVFGDILARAEVELGRVQVTGLPQIRTTQLTGKSLKLTGVLKPAVLGTKGKLTLYAAHPGQALKLTATRPLKAGAATFTQSFTLGKGKWNYQLRYANPGVILTGSTQTKTVTVP